MTTKRKSLATRNPYDIMAECTAAERDGNVVKFVTVSTHELRWIWRLAVSEGSEKAMRVVDATLDLDVRWIETLRKLLIAREDAFDWQVSLQTSSS